MKRKARTKDRTNISVSLPTATVEALDELAGLVSERLAGGKIRISRSAAIQIAATKELEREKARERE